MFYLPQVYFNFFKAFNNSSTFMTLDQHYWNNRYQQKETGWDMGSVSTPLKAYIDQIRDKNIAILIPGCGNAHEAAYLIQNGFKNITIVDYAELVVNDLKIKFKAEEDAGILKIIKNNFFELTGQFDLIIEQTFFCALDPLLREKYAQKMYSLLNQEGKLVGVLFSFALTSEGPPFGGDALEYKDYFKTKFNINVLEDCYNSIQPRKGRELFMILKKAKQQ